MSYRRAIVPVLAISGLLLGAHECRANTLIFSNTGAGNVGVITGANIDYLHEVNGAINAGSSGVSVGMTSSTMAIQFNDGINSDVNSSLTNTGAVDFSNASLSSSNTYNCNYPNAGNSCQFTSNSGDFNGSLTFTNGTYGSNSSNTTYNTLTNNAEAEAAAVSSYFYNQTGTSVTVNSNSTTTINTSSCTPSTYTNVYNSQSITACVYTISNTSAISNGNIQITGNGTYAVVLNYKYYYSNTDDAGITGNFSITESGGINANQILLNVANGSNTGADNILDTTGGTIDADLAVTSGSVELENETIKGTVFLNGTGGNFNNVNTQSASTLENDTIYSADAAAPEPGTLVLGGLALAGLGWMGRRRRTAQNGK